MSDLGLTVLTLPPKEYCDPRERGGTGTEDGDDLTLQAERLRKSRSGGAVKGL